MRKKLAFKKAAALLLTVCMLCSMLFSFSLDVFAYEKGGIKNGGFEETDGNTGRPLYWEELTFGNTGTFSAVSGGRKGNCVKITADSTDYGIITDNESFVEVESGEDYILQYYVKTLGEKASVKPYIRQRRKTGEPTSKDSVFYLDDYAVTKQEKWQKVTVRISAAADAGYFAVGFLASDGDVYVDEVSIKSVRKEAPEGDGVFSYIPDAEFEKYSDNDFEEWDLFAEGAENGVSVSQGSGKTDMGAVFTQTQGGAYAGLTNKSLIPVEPNTNYVVSYYAKISDASPYNGVYAMVRQCRNSWGRAVKDSEKEFLKQERTSGNLKEWRELTFEFETASDAKYVELSVVFGDTDGEGKLESKSVCRVDMVSMVKLNPVKAMAAAKVIGDQIEIPNWDFEASSDTAFEYFTNSSSGDFTLQIDEKGYNGERSPLINKNGAGYFRMTTESAVEVSENQSYEFTYNAKMIGDDGAARQYVQIDQRNANGVSIGKLNSEAITGNTDGWQEYKFSFTVSAGVKSIYISLCFDTEGAPAPSGSAAASWGNIALRGSGEAEAPEEIVIENGDFQLTNNDPRSLFEYFTVGASNNVEYSVDQTGFDPENTGSGKIAPKIVKNALGALNLQYNKPISVKPGKTYEISYWVKIEGDNGAVRQFCNLHMNGPFSSYTATNNPPLTTNTDGWQKITFQTEFDPKCTSVDIILVIDSDIYQCPKPNGSATVWYGEVTMKEVTEKDPYTQIPNSDFQQTTVGAPHYFDNYMVSENVENITFSVAENAFDPENTGSGKKAPKVEKTGNSSWRMETKDSFPFKQNTEYEFSYWVKIEGENGAA
ncbi:MAG: carbohydrate binding domain-containing protein, partial [Acutalibacteraceae bacterium]